MKKLKEIASRRIALVGESPKEIIIRGAIALQN